MFTGIIQHLGAIREVEPRPGGVSLSINAAGWSHRPAHGESISVNGCCLTLASTDRNGCLHFDVIAQTLSVTTLGQLQDGDQVNLEHAVTPATMLGGHIVQGHVDGIGAVSDVRASAHEHRLRIQPPSSLMDWIVERGSIAVNGVSLTIAAVDEKSFEVALIPTTLNLTNLGRLTIGDRVNLEADYVAKIVTNWLERR